MIVILTLRRDSKEELRTPFKAVFRLLRGVFLFGAVTFPVWYWALAYVSVVQPYLVQPRPFASLEMATFLLLGAFGTWSWLKAFGGRLGHRILYRSD